MGASTVPLWTAVLRTLIFACSILSSHSSVQPVLETVAALMLEDQGATSAHHCPFQTSSSHLHTFRQQLNQTATRSSLLVTSGDDVTPQPSCAPHVGSCYVHRRGHCSTTNFRNPTLAGFQAGAVCGGRRPDTEESPGEGACYCQEMPAGPSCT